ncbi:MAG: hypothetical protein QOH26_1990, partial [Actinomycetota bacterium]|nr:hypothetical protein [Actinomycetota bacterium]
IVTLLVMTLAVLEVALALYGRNVVASSAHEATRAAIERGRGPGDAAAVARSTVERAAGRLVTDLEVKTTIVESDSRRFLQVIVTGRLRGFGPVPIPIHLSSTSTAAFPPEP